MRSIGYMHDLDLVIILQMLIDVFQLLQEMGAKVKVSVSNLLVLVQAHQLSKLVFFLPLVFALLCDVALLNMWWKDAMAHILDVSYELGEVFFTKLGNQISYRIFWGSLAPIMFLSPVWIFTSLNLNHNSWWVTYAIGTYDSIDRPWQSASIKFRSKYMIGNKIFQFYHSSRDYVYREIVACIK